MASASESTVPCVKTGLELSANPSLQNRAMDYQRICVVGLGYVGLPTALLFAQHGFDVQGVDISLRVLTMLDEGTVPQAYPELAHWWACQDAKPRFRASNQPEPADVFLITTPTPVHPEDKTCDLSMVRAAVESIIPVLQPGNLVILESTVPPGTTRRILQPLLEAGTGLNIGPGPEQNLYLCFSPERVLPGNTTEELVNNDRVVGGVTPESALLGQLVLQRILKGRVDVTDDLTAEFCKLAENTYRDVNIALANELSVLADEYGIDMPEARQIINRHPRVNLLKPGIGVGGHCIAVDPWFFVEASPFNTQLIATSRRVNDRMPQYTAEKILREVADLEKPKILLAGLTYKANIGDTRESPALRVWEHLQAAGASVIAYDPLLAEHEGKTLVDMAHNTDYLAILIPHDCLLDELELKRTTIEAAMRTPRIRCF